MKTLIGSPLRSLALLAAAVQGSAAADEMQAGTVPEERALHVANNGIDSPTCGARTNRCRSISQAIANAAPGDTISVGPGRYGDLNDDQDFDDPGDEHIGLNESGSPLCIVCVSKPLTILSTHGAENTIIQTAPGSTVSIPHVVAVTASRTTFGQPGQGFTIRYGASSGLFATGVNKVRIGGNIALDNFDFGFELAGSGVFRDNKVTGSNLGVSATGAWKATNNTAIGNTVLGFGFGGESAELRHNVATNNGRGFTVNAQRALVENNVAIGSVEPGADGSSGFTLASPNLVFVRNSAIGNKGYGVRILSDSSGPTVFRQNNLYGNDIVSNCGLANLSGVTVDASRNYWGAPTGPGPDPADDAGPGSGCDLAGNTIVEPFSSHPFAIRE